MLKRVGFAAVVVLFTSGLFAQSRMMSGGHSAAGGGHGFAPAHRNSFRISIGSGFNRRGFRRSGFFNGAYLYPGFYPDYYPEYFDHSYENEPTPPPPEPQPAARQAVAEPIPAPALLELQGNRWVKVDNFTVNPTPPEVASQAAPAENREMPPTVLVYRDGHTEELMSYSIIGNSIYTKSDYWTNGAWTRSIQIADLDLPRTLKQNQQRGVKFELPSGPDEVMIRP